MRKWWKNNWWVALTITLLVGTTIACFAFDDTVGYGPLNEGMVVDKKYHSATGGFLFYEGERFVLIIYNEINGKSYMNRIYVPEYEYKSYTIGDWWRKNGI